MAASRRAAGLAAATVGVVPFGPASFFNRALGDRAATVRTSPLVAELRRQVRATGTWMNTTRYSVPVYRVRARQRAVKVRLDTADPALQAAFDAVPLPAGAAPAAGRDASLVVWQRATDTVWELWRARRRADGWHAAWGGRIAGASTASGIHPAPYGVTASGLSLLGGMIRPGELRRGRIDHVVGIAVPRVAAGVFAFPADRTDGRVSGAGIPLGTRFRLPPRLDVARLRLSPAATAIARAAQRYGIVVQDTGGCVAFYGEAPHGRRDPWPRLLGHQMPRRALAGFPWRSLEVVRSRPG